MPKYTFPEDMLTLEDKDKTIHLTESQMKVEMQGLLAETILMEQNSLIADPQKIKEVEVKGKDKARIWAAQINLVKNRRL